MASAHQQYFGEADHGLLNVQNVSGYLQPIYRNVSALIIDHFFVASTHLKHVAENLDYRRASGTYLGRLAKVPRDDYSSVAIRFRLVDVIGTDLE